jgi:hypothetical protein
MAKQTVLLLSNKKKQTIDSPNNKNGFQRPYVEGKKQVSKGCLLYAAIYLTFPKIRNCGEREQISDCQGLGRECSVTKE